MKRTYFLLLVISFFTSAAFAQEWVVPAESIGRLSSFAFSDSTRKAGTVLFNTNCKSCHGDPGKNNAVKLVPPPPDPASAQMQKNSDGSLSYKISAGRGTMPSFKNALSASDIWYVVSYIRGFNEKYVQEIAKKPAPGSTFDQVKMIIAWNKADKIVEVKLSAVKEKIRQPVAGAEVKLFAKRYFGNLPIDQSHATDNQGVARFNFPTDLPGDSLGLVLLQATPSDEAAFGEAKADTALAIGLPTYRPPLNEQRALWNVVQKTPIWLLLTYSLSVLAVWGLIAFVLMQLRAIYLAGSNRD